MVDQNVMGVDLWSCSNVPVRVREWHVVGDLLPWLAPSTAKEFCRVCTVLVPSSIDREAKLVPKLFPSQPQDHGTCWKPSPLTCARTSCGGEGGSPLSPIGAGAAVWGLIVVATPVIAAETPSRCGGAASLSNPSGVGRLRDESQGPGGLTSTGLRGRDGETVVVGINSFLPPSTGGNCASPHTLVVRDIPLVGLLIGGQ